MPELGYAWDNLYLKYNQILKLNVWLVMMSHAMINPLNASIALI